MSLEVLIPFDRADQGLAVQLRRLARAAAWLPGLSRVLLVADAPGVQVPSQVASAAGELPCRWLKLSQAQGPAAAVAAGIQSAEGQTLVTMAPGPVFPVEQIPWLVKRLVRADVVWGRRSSTRVGKWWHRWRSLPLRMVLGPGVRDPGCLFWAARTEVFRQAPLPVCLVPLLPWWATALGFRTTELNVFPRCRQRYRVPLPRWWQLAGFAQMLQNSQVPVVEPLIVPAPPEWEASPKQAGEPQAA